MSADLAAIRRGLAALRARRQLSPWDHLLVKRDLLEAAHQLARLKLEDFLEDIDRLGEHAERDHSPEVGAAVAATLAKLKRLATLAQALRAEVLDQADAELADDEAAEHRRRCS